MSAKSADLSPSLFLRGLRPHGAGGFAIRDLLGCALAFSAALTRTLGCGTLLRCAGCGTAGGADAVDGLLATVTQLGEMVAVVVLGTLRLNRPGAHGAP
jgi:hypothetical protein